MKYTTLITGASSGIGLELAHRAAIRGDNIIIVARRKEKLAELKDELIEKYGATVSILEKNLSLVDTPRSIYEEIKNLGLTVDHLINNAGFGEFGVFHEISPERQTEMIDLNIRSLTEMTRLFLPDMLSRKYGRIMNVASTAAFQPGPGMSVYFATKSYVLSFSEGIAEELTGTGVTVTALCPGPTESEFAHTSKMDTSSLFHGRKLPTSREVAVYGYDAMMKGKVVAVHGWMNWILSESIRFTPRWLVRKIIKKMQKKVG